MDACKPLPGSRRRRGGSRRPGSRVITNRVTRYDPISIWEIDMGDRTTMGYRTDVDVGCGFSIWDTACRYGYLPSRYGHPEYRYETWSNDMGDDVVDMVISHIDMIWDILSL